MNGSKNCLAAVLLLLAVADTRAGDCDRVPELMGMPIEQLNAGGLIDAATRYERGNCVPQDWEKAAQYYQRAVLGGVEKALAPLIALYAVKYRDPAAALYWASRKPKILPKACIAAANPAKDPAAFVSELRTWPATKLQACTYQAGVAARIMNRFNQWGGVYLDLRGRGSLYDARIDVQLNAASGSIEWVDDDEEAKVVSSLKGDSGEPDVSNVPKEGSSQFYFWLAGVQALQEFGLPPQAEPAWNSKFKVEVVRSMRGSRLPTVVGVAQ